MKSPLVVHVPHASVAISEHDLRDFLLNQDEIAHEQRRLTDWYTDELFAENWNPQNVIQFLQSRLVVDVERYVSDAQEPCAEVGMGATYLKTTLGTPLRNLTPQRREELIQNYYIPHHKLFTQCLDQSLALFNRCVILDGHSYPTEPLPTQRNYQSTPEIGIGTEGLFTPPQLLDLTLKYFESHGLTVAINEPFTGAFVPDKFYQSQDNRVESVMIEIRRDLYLDESTAQKNSRFGALKSMIHGYRQAVAEYSLTE